MELSYKTICGIISAALNIACFIPYLRDTYKKTTKPHIYTWLIWTILQVTGTIAMYNSGAGMGTLSLAIGAVFCAYVCLLSLKLGTKNITTFDTICLIGALGATAIYIFLKDPLLSIILISIIDFTGFLPTLRKAYAEPYSETLAMFALFAFSGVFSVAAIASYSLVTLLYPLTLIAINILATVVIYMKRKRPTQPSRREG
jgi:hypothetical protein